MVTVSSTLVNVSDEAEVRLVALLAGAAPPNLLSPTFQDDCQKSIDAGEAGPLLNTILKDAGAVASLLSIESADEATAAFSLVAALLERAGTPLHDVINVIVSAEQVPNKQERKISLLSVLYNMRSDVGDKVLLLQKMLELAGSCPNSAELLAPEDTLGRILSDPVQNSLSAYVSSDTVARGSPVAYQPRLVGMLDEWNVPQNDSRRRDLYKTVASVLPPTDVRRQRFLLLFVESYGAQENVSNDIVIELAKDAVIGAIRDPVSLFVHQRSMMSLPAVQAVGSKYRVLLGLLRVFQEGKLSDYNAFVQSNGGSEEAVLSPWGLDVQACKRNIRILSLCSLASEHEEIPYKVVAETLQLPSDGEVESWVIAAVSSGLLQAKMDQLECKVMVERSVVRKFDMDQWKALQGRLRLWRQNVGGVLASLKESQL